MPPPPLRFRLITKYSKRNRRSRRNPFWPTFLLTPPDDSNPRAHTRSSSAVFLLFARDFLLCPLRPHIPQLASPVPPPQSFCNAHSPNAATPATSMSNQSKSPRSGPLPGPTARPTAVQPPSAPSAPSASSVSLTTPSITTNVTSTTTSTFFTSTMPLTFAPTQLEQATRDNPFPSSTQSECSPRTPPRQAVRLCLPRPPRNYSHDQTADPTVPFLPGFAKLKRDQFIDLCDEYILDKLRDTDGAPLPSPGDPVSVFYGVSPPPISVRDYVQRLVYFSESSPAAFVIMLDFVRRVGLRKSELRLHSLNLHRLLITSLAVASKLLDDRCFSNAHYAKVGGVPSPDEMTTLELLLLRFLDYNLSVSELHFNDMMCTLLTLREPKPSYLKRFCVSMVTAEDNSGAAAAEGAELE